MSVSPYSLTELFRSASIGAILLAIASAGMAQDVPIIQPGAPGDAARELTAEQEKDLLNAKLNRVTDTCIPEDEAMRVIDKLMINQWVKSDKEGERLLPHEFLFRIIDVID